MTNHVCAPSDFYYGGGIGRCSCGMWWQVTAFDLVKYALVARALLQRLSDYRLGIEFGRYPDIRSAVRAAADRERAAAVSGKAEIRRRWLARQAAAESAYFRHVRPILLARPCAYCGGDAAHVDHVIPRSRGGQTRMRNLAPACAKCNAEKGNRTPEQWRAWREARGRPWPPVRQECAA